MDNMRHGVEKIQNTKELADSRLHILEGHFTPRNLSQKLSCIYSKRLVDETEMAAVRAIHEEMAEQFANELPAWMVCFHSVNVVIDVQFMLPGISQRIDFQDDMCRFTRFSKLRIA